MFTGEIISSLKVPDAKFQEAKLDYLGQIIIIPEFVTKKIKATKDNKSPGVDGIPPKLLMEAVEQINIPLARVFIVSLNECFLLNGKAQTSDHYLKKGSRHKLENYRPV